LTLIMQNKANLFKDKINATLFATKDYENKSALAVMKNKANQSQLQNRGQIPAFSGYVEKLFYKLIVMS